MTTANQNDRMMTLEQFKAFLNQTGWSHEVRVNSWTNDADSDDVFEVLTVEVCSELDGVTFVLTSDFHYTAGEPDSFKMVPNEPEAPFVWLEGVTIVEPAEYDDEEWEPVSNVEEEIEQFIPDEFWPIDEKELIKKYVK